jgi:hypothetical protein
MQPSVEESSHATAAACCDDAQSCTLFDLCTQRSGRLDSRSHAQQRHCVSSAYLLSVCVVPEQARSWCWRPCSSPSEHQSLETRWCWCQTTQVRHVVRPAGKLSGLLFTIYASSLLFTSPVTPSLVQHMCMCMATAGVACHVCVCMCPSCRGAGRAGCDVQVPQLGVAALGRQLQCEAAAGPGGHLQRPTGETFGWQQLSVVHACRLLMC